MNIGKGPRDIYNETYLRLVGERETETELTETVEYEYVLERPRKLTQVWGTVG